MKNKLLAHVLIVMIAMFLILLLMSVSLFQIRLYHLDSMSMRPILKEGSLLLCKSETYDQLKEGEIITYKINNAYITSRITHMDTEEKQLYVKMDTQEDIRCIEYKQYTGTMLFAIPYLGMILQFLKGSIGKMLCFVLLFLILIKIGLNLLDKKRRRMFT